MRRAAVVLVAGLGLLSSPGWAQAQVDLRVQVTLPTIRFETAPALVVVDDGVQVVPDCDEEVFAADGWYWYRAGDHWYRTRDHRGGWARVHREHVPVTLVHIPPGKYKRYRGKGSKKAYVQDSSGRITEVKLKDKGKGHGKNKDKKGKGGGWK